LSLARAGAPVVAYDEAIRSCDELLRLKANTLAAAVALVPAALGAFVRVTRRLVAGDVVCLQTEAQHWAPAWQRYLTGELEGDPFAPQRVAPSNAMVLRLADVDDPQVRRRLAALGIGDRMTTYLRSAGTVVASITLLRAAGSPPFDNLDARSLRRIQPLLEHSYVCAVQPRQASARAALLQSGLTDREAEVAGLVGRGASNAEIARSLHVSEATVKTHLGRVYAKAGVRSRTQLAVLVSGRSGGVRVSVVAPPDEDPAGAPGQPHAEERACV
jgi:DNA-binding NarL/FixJ family response regulator